eukprot:GFKZ01000164.1.p1 GENE.GFKZ01000164.1~~GFKZ01000164.1.p1  ORF type:complete len:106 (-),score=1.13 GFKZ01000164.1:726-1043(-)
MTSFVRVDGIPRDSKARGTNFQNCRLVCMETKSAFSKKLSAAWKNSAQCEAKPIAGDINVDRMAYLSFLRSRVRTAPGEHPDWVGGCRSQVFVNGVGRHRRWCSQ